MMNDKLMKNISKLGFPMFETTEALDVNETLAEVVKSQDMRLWEGFPVLLANAADNYQFAIKQIENQLQGKQEKERFHQLLLVSISLYSFFNLNFPWVMKFVKTLSLKDQALAKKWRNCLAHDQKLAGTAMQFDPARLKGLFKLYFEQTVEKNRQKKETYEEFSLAFALSQVFSPKQRELFNKKLEGLPLTKTELEYYSRSVKKKVVALANSELNSLARKLLEK